MRIRSLLRSMSVTCAFAMAACGDDGLTSPGSDELARAVGQWNRGGLDRTTYLMRQQRQCFCIDGAVVYQLTVTQNVITDAVNVATGAHLAAAERSRLRTVSQLFDEVRAGLVSTNVLRSVTYDPTLGYPTRLSLDPVPSAVDDEVTYLTSGVQPASLIILETTTR